MVVLSTIHLTGLWIFRRTFAAKFIAYETPICKSFAMRGMYIKNRKKYIK